MQQPHVRKSMKLGSRRMSDGLEIYKAMIEDTMQSIRPELVEAMENYKVCETKYIIQFQLYRKPEIILKTNFSDNEYRQKCNEIPISMLVHFHEMLVRLCVFTRFFSNFDTYYHRGVNDPPPVLGSY